jgi:hypothetical protein
VRMSRTQAIIRIAVAAALMGFVYWVVFTNAGAGR